MPRPRRKERFWLHQGPSEQHWSICWYDATAKRTRRKSTGEREHSQAEIRLAEHVLEHDKPKNAAPESVGLGQILVIYAQEHITTLASRESGFIAVEHLNRHFGDCPISDLTPDAVEGYVTARREHVSDSTIRRELTVLSGAISRAHRRGILLSAPFIENIRPNDPPERKLTIDEMARLVNAIDAPHVMDWFMAAATTLARPENVLDLTRNQINFDDRLITLNPKGRRQTIKRRPIVPMCDTFAWWFRDIDRVYLVEWKGQPIRSMKRAIRRLRRVVGLPATFVSKSIRHTMATELRRRGVSVDDLAGVLGHSRNPITELYGEYSPDYLGDVSRAIDAYFVDLQKRVDRAITPEFRPNAVSPAVVPMPKSLGRLVGAAGFEPTTPTPPGKRPAAKSRSKPGLSKAGGGTK